MVLPGNFIKNQLKLVTKDFCQTYFVSKLKYKL